jgi:uncharacterized protein YyaL (SSP411 family)
MVGREAAPIVAARFGVTPQGNFEDRETVLSIAKSVPELAAEFGRPEAEIASLLAETRTKMYAARADRVAPATDDKLLTDWSALAISAFALASRVLAEPRYEKAARDAADRILRNCVRDGRLLHREKAGSAAIPGFATDYAYGIEALLDLYEATFEPRYFREALAFQEVLDRDFADPRGGYFLSAQAHDGLIVRPRESTTRDAVFNSVAASNLLRLAAFTGDERAEARGRDLRGLRRTARASGAGVSAAPLRARFPGVGPARGRAGGRARATGLRGAAPRRFREPRPEPGRGARRIRGRRAGACSPDARADDAGRKGRGVRLRALRLPGAGHGARGTRGAPHPGDGMTA